MRTSSGGAVGSGVGAGGSGVAGRPVARITSKGDDSGIAVAEGASEGPALHPSVRIKHKTEKISKNLRIPVSLSG